MFNLGRLYVGVQIVFHGRGMVAIRPKKPNTTIEDFVQECLVRTHWGTNGS